MYLIVKQLALGNTKGIGNLDNRIQRGTFLATLNGANISSVYVTLECKLFLRVTCILTQFCHTFAKGDIFCCLHGCKDKKMLPLAQRTKDSILHFFGGNNIIS